MPESQEALPEEGVAMSMLRAMSADIAAMRCSDGYCDLGGAAKGMHTNGGCKCLADVRSPSKRSALRTMLRAARVLALTPGEPSLAVPTVEQMAEWIRLWADRYAERQSDVSDEVLRFGLASYLVGKLSQEANGGKPRVMGDREVIDAIRARHLKANIDYYESKPGWYTLRWEAAWLDPGGSIFGPGPYVKLPVDIHEPDCTDDAVIRVYAPARLRRRLAARWAQPASEKPVVGGKITNG